MGDPDHKKMLDRYILDYLLKNNMHATAAAFAKEADINCVDPVPINVSQGGFLKEWWRALYSVRTNHADPTTENPSPEDHMPDSRKV